MTVTVTFTGTTLEDAMIEARDAGCEYVDMALAYNPETKKLHLDPSANGESKEDVVETDDTATDFRQIRAEAISLLTQVFGADDKAGASPQDAVNALLEKYNVDNLQDVEDEKVSDFFSDAKQLADVFGVTV